MRIGSDGGWLQALIPAGALLLLAIRARRTHDSWLAPGAFFCLMWTVYTLLPLLIAREYYFWAPAIWWITICVAAVYIGSLLGCGGHISRTGHPVIQELPMLRLLTVIFTSLGIASVLGMLLLSGHSITELFSLEGHTTLAEELSWAQRSERYLVIRIFRLFIYAGGFFGGVLFLRGGRIVSLLPFVPAFIMSFILTTRSWVFYTVLCWIGSYLSWRVMRGDKILFTRRHFLALLVIIPVLSGFFIMAHLLRRGEVSIGLFKEILYSVFGVYFFGYLSAFSIWMEHGGWGPATLGAYTVGGIFNILGLRERRMGLFEFVEIADGRMTNVYTVFRSLMEDFTPGGAILVLFLIGIVSGMVYRRVSRGDIRYVPALAMFYAFTLWTPITSLLNYNTIIAAWVVFGMYLFLVWRVRRGGS